MHNGKGSNARKIGPMTEAVAQELRAELARQRRSAKSLAESAGLNRSTLHKTLNAQRAIDVDDLFHLADLLDVSPSEMFAKAEALARAELDDGLLPGEREGMPAGYESGDINSDTDQDVDDASNVGGSGQDATVHDLNARRQAADPDSALGADLSADEAAELLRTHRYAADERDGRDEEAEADPRP
ncbi:helix-turn-helix domain-containing protein [Leucobacter massiliensis]|uniref:HTH cro/C1-type domain-containing protein n=1 Tax=Leucobacter massiliensis TaxID=1686285 RepID=A0A2S9QMY8_9MICO|nr:helix-turn-helix transcriptional regulator [Leucobacter massiliensis]PRI10956.1 hypothetical protein B4915_08715 [Leucobacter massiliensis]